MSYAPPAGYAPQWRKYTVTSAQLSAALFTNSITLFSLLAGEVLHAVVIAPTVAFAGGAIATYTLSVGIAATPAKYAAASSVFTGAVPAAQFIPGMESWSVPTSITVTAISTVGLLNAATAGSAEIWVLVSRAKE